MKRLPMEIEKLRERRTYIPGLAGLSEKKDEVGRKKAELGAETEWDKIEERGADEGWGCWACGRAAEEDSDVVVAGGRREEERRNNG